MYRTLIAFLILALASLTSCTNEPKKERVMDPLNPFFNQYETPFEVPPFDQIKPEHYLPAFEEGMAQQKEAVEAILASKKKPTFRNTLEALDQSGELLSRVSSVFYGLSSANTNEDLQKIQLEISPKMAAHSDEINLNPNLFKRIKSVYDNREKMKLTEEQAYILENKYKELVRNGANLPDDKKEELKQINQELSILGVQFSQNVLEETNAFSLVIDHPADLKGLSQTSVDAAAEAAAEAGMPGKWVFTAQKPSWIPFLQSAHNRELRKELYAGWLNRGNRNNEYDNKEILAKMMALRAQKAHLLGYASHADLVMESRMAKTPENVMALLDQVWKPALAAAIRDRDQMQEIIRREGGRFQLEAHDWWMYAEKLRKEQFDLDESELRPYFKLENVSRGVFDVANKLYGITFTEITDIPKPHSEAVAYEVKEADGSHLGVLYMDFHPRASKRQGAWCGGYRGHHVKDGQEITPVVTIVCNFTRPSGNQPALLSPDEVETLFHEFGHGLDNLFSTRTMRTSYAARDFVELPSQIMEHWAMEPEVLKSYALHYQTGDPIPDYLIEKINKSSKFNQGFNSVEFLAACYIDMAYHTLTDTIPVDVVELERAVAERTGLIPEIKPRYHSWYFTHITGGYDAGYYSYEWSAVLDHDAFEAFRENGIFDQATAQSFRKNVLEKNGMADAMEMFVKFRGREPDITPLMRNRGFLE
ncbi:MAG: M3 family metallopeptidase [Bacteroidales bacterium]|jgi:peptidyl-dipeptidase Dcp|nr:M3 family metallopeptidase [Bacteroidales bacterium]MDD2571470.1 M3 family metallopeptidase [Bacteroidales bacterium]MDD2812487.1 M3 family metallopeptidase [Bacteroidales bacterium]MDD3384315.1 M3 family metallopeptidase [Bacteroidales bacterium]MDD3810806.1 M3 family metallopeptidase [Bacteroidales bacterium]